MDNLKTITLAALLIYVSLLGYTLLIDGCTFYHQVAPVAEAMPAWLFFLLLMIPGLIVFVKCGKGKLTPLNILLVIAMIVLCLAMYTKVCVITVTVTNF